MKKWMALLLVIVLALGMTGCGSSGKAPEPTATPEPTPTPAPTPKIEYFSQCSNLPKPTSIIDNVVYDQTLRGVILYVFTVDSSSEADSLYQTYLDVICDDYGFSTQQSSEKDIKLLKYNSKQVGTIGVTQADGKYYLAFYFY